MKEEIPWYSEEAGLFGDVYFKIFGGLIREGITETECDFVEKSLELKPGAKILDLCCGHGRHSLELAKRGYDVTGQDLSSNFLAMAEESAVKAGVNVSLVHGDMREINFEDEFDAVIMMFTAFGVLETDEENQKVISAVSISLKKGGKFLMDFANRDRIVRNYLSKDHRCLSDGTLVVIDRRFDHVFGGHFETIKLISPDGNSKEFKINLRFYTVPEIAAMFKTAGLELVKSYGDFDFTPISFSSPNYILIGEKK
jgi:ubiquinone/menaquinone biosynthesis C-methylase UbiE